MLRRSLFAAAVTVLSAGLLTVTTTPAMAGTDQAGALASADMFSALQRDLGLTPAQAEVRLATDARAAADEQALRARLGARFGGAWVGAGGNQLVVAVTDPAAVAAVTAQGARAQIVARSEAQLAAVQDRLDGRLSDAPAGVTGWYVDVAGNTVVVEAVPGAVPAATAFVQHTGAPAAAVRVVPVAEAPRTFYDTRGGDAYYMGGRCSIGFAVVGGFVSAGHCGRSGTAVQGFNRVSMGSFAGSSFPGNDYSWVRTNGSWVSRGVVNRYSGNSTVAVRGSAEAAVGASICRSGSTTGWRCGTVQAKNQTIRYAQGAVSGMTRTNACAEPGDSGGAWLSGNQAQGVTSGGSGNCRSGGTTYFQPVNEILSTYRLRLVTS